VTRSTTQSGGISCFFYACYENPVNSNVKRYRIVKDRFRLWKQGLVIS
jgi:hypothetical protein